MRTPDRLPALVNEAPALRRRGRTLNADVLVEIRPRTWLLRIREGVVEAVTPGPHLLPSWTFSLRFDLDAWDQFMIPLPPPGRNDLMALIRHGKLQVEGTLHPFMAHLFWFKEAFAKLRDAGPSLCEAGQ
ncbi:MAG: hypothetical protein EXR01_05015 [Acetobacteraceae bacterium]|nr:hypothetical protein [Acetobacteraceae bacterium]MSP30958.1 hypothetical protein [Acetobacteraceae bacterium]